MLRCVTLVRTDVSEEYIASTIKGTRIDEPGTMLALFIPSVRPLLVTANVVPSSPSLVTLMMEALNSYGTSVLTRATQRNIQEDGIFYSHRRENLKSYTISYIISNSSSMNHGSM
jgi:hypothetical protein